MAQAPVRRATNLSLDAALVARARRHAPNLSETVNRLLAEFVAAREAEARAADARIAASIAASNAFIEAHGAFGDEHSTLQPLAQFDVHANEGRNRAVIPFVVILQSARFDASRRRVVAPLLDAAAFGAAVSDTTPAFMIRGRRAVLDPFQIQTIPREALGERVASLADDANAALVQRALDELFSRAFG